MLQSRYFPSGSPVVRCVQHAFSRPFLVLTTAFCWVSASLSPRAWEERWCQISASGCFSSLWDLGLQVQATLVALSFKFHLHRLIRLAGTWLRHWASESPLHVLFLCCPFHTASKFTHSLRGSCLHMLGSPHCPLLRVGTLDSEVLPLFVVLEYLSTGACLCMHTCVCVSACVLSHAPVGGGSSPASCHLC